MDPIKRGRDHGVKNKLQESNPRFVEAGAMQIQVESLFAYEPLRRDLEFQFCSKSSLLDVRCPGCCTKPAGGLMVNHVSMSVYYPWVPRMQMSCAQSAGEAPNASWRNNAKLSKLLRPAPGFPPPRPDYAFSPSKHLRNSRP